jgi:hypothetical protein
MITNPRAHGPATIGRLTGNRLSVSRQTHPKRAYGRRSIRTRAGYPTNNLSNNLVKNLGSRGSRRTALREGFTRKTAIPTEDIKRGRKNINARIFQLQGKRRKVRSPSPPRMMGKRRRKRIGTCPGPRKAMPSGVSGKGRKINFPGLIGEIAENRTFPPGGKREAAALLFRRTTGIGPRARNLPMI